MRPVASRSIPLVAILACHARVTPGWVWDRVLGRSPPRPNHTGVQGYLLSHLGPPVPGHRSVLATLYSGWKTAMVLPSGSLNQAERPMPGEVTMWSMVLNVSVWYSSNSMPFAASTETSLSMSVDHRRT